jgi:hypothetical protein
MRYLVISAAAVALVVGLKWLAWRRTDPGESPTDRLRRLNRQMMEDVEPW